MSHQSDLIEKDILAYLSQHERKDMLRFLTCGSVDDGKSTLIGRLLHDSKLIYEDQLAAIKQESRRFGTTGDEMDLALLVDGLQAEREQGITIDVAYRYFSTAKRKFIIADTPGHEQYTRNMATGASTCDLAIILVDARHGVVTQTKRHTFIVSLLGIKHVIVAVNKMDLVGFSEEAFEKIKSDYTDFSARLDLGDVSFVPISALKGDNVVHPSTTMPWYSGATLMHLLENVHIASDRNFTDFRFPVQLVLRPNLNFRGFSGTIASGVVRKGDKIMALPSRKTSRVKSIATLDGDLDEAFAGMAVTLTLEDEIDIPRGDLIVHPDNLAVLDERFEAMIVWMAEEPMKPGKQYLIKHATKVLPGHVETIQYKVNINTLQHESGEQLQLNEIAHCSVELSQPVAFDPYRNNREMGAFILVDRMTNTTVGAGMILDRVTAAHVEDVQRMVQEALQKYEQRNPRLVSVEERLARQKHKPATLLFTGLVGSGRLVVSYAVERKLFERGIFVQIIDNRTSRLGQTAALDFSSQESSTGLRRAAEVSRLFNEMGMITICSFVAPRSEDRTMVQAIVGADKYLEVYLSCTMDVARKRDKSGLYQRADLGHIKDFPGVSPPYEAPSNPDLVLDTVQLRADECVERVIDFLEKRGIIPRPA